MIEVRPVPADDPRIVALVQAHVAEMDGTTPPEACHRLEPADLEDPGITMLAALDGDHDVVAIGAYADRGDGWGEVKSMHVRADHRGHGISRRILAAIEDVARRAGATVLRLETSAVLTPAIGLYTASGYGPCGAFGGYDDHPTSVFLAKHLSPDRAPRMTPR